MLFPYPFFVTDKLKLPVSTSPKESRVIKLVTGVVSVPTKSGLQFPSAHESYNLEVDPSKNAVTITGKSLLKIVIIRMNVLVKRYQLASQNPAKTKN